MNHIAFITKRALQLILLAYLVTTATFFLTSLIPGDFFTNLEANPSIRPETIAQLRQTYGTAQPFYVQYSRWLVRCLRLDLGYSLFYGKPVATVVADAARNTLWIGLPALLVGLLGGIVLGTLHATQQGKPLGYCLDVFSTVVLSLPALVLGLGALLVASHSHWFPLGGMSSVQVSDPDLFSWLLDRIRHLALPAFCLTLPVLATTERVQYAAARGTLQEGFVRSARARGLPRRDIFWYYLVRPSLNPVLSTLGPIFAGILSGSLILELMFSWPGLGKITYDALFNRDILLVLGCVAIGSLLLVLGNLVADILLFALEPRTRGPVNGGRA